MMATFVYFICSRFEGSMHLGLRGNEKTPCSLCSVHGAFKLLCQTWSSYFFNDNELTDLLRQLFQPKD